MSKILCLAGYYLPGYKGGGPIKTLASMVDRLGDEFSFLVVAIDRDLGDVDPYPDIEANRWISMGNAQAIYFSADKFHIPKWTSFLRSMKYDLLYINSFFAFLTIQTLVLQRLGQIPSVPTIIAPRGQFSPGAMQYGRRKKTIFLRLAGTVGLYRGSVWQASSEFEAHEIRTMITQYRLDDAPTILVAPNLSPPISSALLIGHQLAKRTGFLDIVFISRIARKKNLDFALSCLQGIKGNVKFDIYGPIEDAVYWRDCQQIISTLPSNVNVTYQGGILSNVVKEVFASYHAFLFPTWGENFGHVILEALSVGCPVIISDQTPWQRLSDQAAGWDLPLGQIMAFRQVLDQLVSMDHEEWVMWSVGAQKVAETFTNDPAIVEANRLLFHTALTGVTEL